MPDVSTLVIGHLQPPDLQLLAVFSTCSSRDPGGPCAFGLEADVSDCFYNYTNECLASWFGINLPLTCSQWKLLGWDGGSIYYDQSKSFEVPKDDTILYPVFRGLCMGWSWALWLANEAVCFAVAGRIERPLGEIRDRLPAPSFEPQQLKLLLTSFNLMAFLWCGQLNNRNQC